jgi:hypothetical protein
MAGGKASVGKQAREFHDSTDRRSVVDFGGPVTIKMLSDGLRTMKKFSTNPRNQPQYGL